MLTEKSLLGKLLLSPLIYHIVVMQLLFNLLLPALFLLFISIATASADTKINRLEQLAIDYAICASYFMITAESKLLSVDESANNNQLSDKALQNSALFNSSNHPMDEAEELTRQHYQRSTHTMLTHLGGDFAKAYLLDSKHLKSCHNLMSDPKTNPLKP